MIAEAPADLTYRPQLKQESWHACPAYESGFGGTKGPGKSLALVIAATRWISHRRYRAILFRRTYPRLRELIDRAHEWYPGLGGSWRGDDKEWIFPSGARIKMAHCQHEDDKRIYHGHEYHFMGFDQLEEFSETQYLFLMAQNRSSVAGIPTYIRSTFNPGGVGHGWVKDRFVDHGTSDCAPWLPVNDEDTELRSRCFHFSTIYDNRALLDADPEYIKTLQALPANERRALLDGDWDVFAGQYFSEWRREKHVIKPFAINPSWYLFRCIDYGTARPFVCLWLAADLSTIATLGKPRIYVYREISKPGIFPASNQALMIQDHSNDEKYKFTVGDPAMWNKTPSGDSVADDYRKGGVHMIPGNHDRINGWNKVHEGLRDAPDGKPFVQVFETCTQLIKNLPSLVHDQHDVEDLDSDGPDDESDAFRYGLMAAPSGGGKLPKAQPVAMTAGRRR